MLKRNGEIVCNYDRGWDVQPVDEDTLIKTLNNVLNG